MEERELLPIEIKIINNELKALNHRKNSLLKSFIDEIRRVDEAIDEMEEILTKNKIKVIQEELI